MRVWVWARGMRLPAYQARLYLPARLYRLSSHPTGDPVGQWRRPGGAVGEGARGHGHGRRPRGRQEARPPPPPPPQDRYSSALCSGCLVPVITCRIQCRAKRCTSCRDGAGVTTANSHSIHPPVQLSHPSPLSTTGSHAWNNPPPLLSTSLHFFVPILATPFEILTLDATTIRIRRLPQALLPTRPSQCPGAPSWASRTSRSRAWRGSR